MIEEIHLSLKVTWDDKIQIKQLQNWHHRLLQFSRKFSKKIRKHKSKDSKKSSGFVVKESVTLKGFSRWIYPTQFLKCQLVPWLKMEFNSTKQSYWMIFESIRQVKFFMRTIITWNQVCLNLFIKSKKSSFILNLKFTEIIKR